MDKLEMMQYLIADTIQQQSDLPKIDECIKKVHIKQIVINAMIINQR